MHRWLHMCRLPLTLAIAGGMVADLDRGFTEDILEAMMETHGTTLEDEGGLTLEERVISSSLKMIKGKNKELVERVFRFFAVFPEDTPVPAGVFDKLASVMSGMDKETKTRLAVGGCLGTLMKFNLLKGSMAGAGVFMHGTWLPFVLINGHSSHEAAHIQTW